jgi:hypothetical protein
MSRYRRRGRNTTGDLNVFVQKAGVTLPLLPLFHTFEGRNLRGIQKAGQLTPTHCPVFDEPLLYLFYGRPAYRVTSAGEQATSDHAFAPVIIAIRPESAASIKRIAPFDTGAFHNNIYETYLHPKMTFDDFLLTPLPETAGKVVSLFFNGSNDDYFHGKSTTIIIDPLHFEAASYQELIKATVPTKHDDRAAAIELQCDQPVNISPNSILLIILPRAFLDDAEVRSTLYNDWRAQVESYSTWKLNTGAYQALIYHFVETFLRQKNLL